MAVGPHLTVSGSFLEKAMIVPGRGGGHFQLSDVQGDSKSFQPRRPHSGAGLAVQPRSRICQPPVCARLLVCGKRMKVAFLARCGRVGDRPWKALIRRLACWAGLRWKSVSSDGFSMGHTTDPQRPVLQSWRLAGQSWLSQTSSGGTLVPVSHSCHC